MKISAVDPSEASNVPNTQAVDTSLQIGICTFIFRGISMFWAINLCEGIKEFSVTEMKHSRTKFSELVGKSGFGIEPVYKEAYQHLPVARS